MAVVVHICIHISPELYLFEKAQGSRHSRIPTLLSVRLRASSRRLAMPSRPCSLSIWLWRFTNSCFTSEPPRVSVFPHVAMDTLSRKERSKRMSLVKSKGNRSTEISLVAQFRAAKIKGWRRNYRILGSPDFVFPQAKLAVFVDGCFWHGCPKHGRVPKTNVSYWKPKIEGNIARDRRVSRQLRAAGWSVLRIWEHDVNKETVLPRIARKLAKLAHAKRRVTS